MNENFRAFVAEGRTLAAIKGINWQMDVDANGAVSPSTAWNLTAMSKGLPPPTYWLRHFGHDRPAITLLNSRKQEGPQKTFTQEALSLSWQELVKSCVIQQLFVQRTTASHVRSGIIRPLFVLATCARAHEPWQLTTDDAVLAFEIARTAQPCGQLADCVLSVISLIFDANQLTDNAPLAPSLTRKHWHRAKRARFAKSADELRSDLDARKGAEKLPEGRAFWELVRIVFTEQPKSLLDLLRFAQARVLILTGLRRGEVAILPVDWKRFREFYDNKGHLAGESGGYSRSLMLRHFAEKQRNMNSESMVLFESAQDVPSIFEETLTRP